MIRFLLLCLSFHPVQDSSWPPVVEVETRGPLVPVPAEGNWRLAYELHITNLERKPVTLSAVEVVGQTRIEAGQLGRDLFHPGVPRPRNPLSIPPGKRAILFVWLSTDRRPDSIRHRVLFADKREVSTSARPVSRAELPPLHPPLRGANWLAGNGPSNGSAHRRALLPFDGRLRISQRFAIDFVKLGPAGATFNGDPKKNGSYLAYGAELLAVAPGKVVALRDGIPGNVPGLRSRAVPITPETIGGNHVVLQLAPHRFAFYAHLQPGSLRVKVGDRVETGQVLGLLGNSGNSTEPHLHFHVMNGPSPLGSEGVPFTFARFGKQGTVREWKIALEKRGEFRRNEMPLQNSILRFDLEPF